LARSGTSITMDRDILKWIDERVKERVFSSRSHAFEYAVRELMRRGYNWGYGRDRQYKD